MADLQQLVSTVISWASDSEQVEAYAAHSRDADVEVYQGGIETLSTAETDGVGIRVVLPGPDGNRQGFAYTGSLDTESLQACLREARDNASFGTPDPFLGLAEPDDVEPVSLDIYRDSLASFPTEAKIEMAMELERLVRAADSRIRSLRSASYGDGLLEVAIASTTGISRQYRRTGVSVAAYAIAGSEDDTQTGFGYSVGRSADEIDVPKAAAMAVERSTRLLGATKPTSRRTAIVFDPYVTASLLSILGGTLNAESVLKGRSLFADRVGETVAVNGFSLIDQPTNPLAFGATPIDAEGLATRELALISGGVLQGFAHNTVTARRMGGAARSTGSSVRGGFKSTPGVGCRALTVLPGTLSQAEIISQVGTGVLVQSVSGIHSGVNPVSGDFSVGAEGLLIENGQLGAPIREFTIASTIQRMLMEILAVGADLEWLPGGSSGVTLAIDGISVSGA